MSSTSFRKSNPVIPFARGTYKNVWHGHVANGPRQGEKCVLKTFAGDSILEDHYFEVANKLIRKAQEIIKAWNDAQIIDKRVVLRTEVGTDLIAGEKCLAEPFTQNFQNFNSNTGWEAPQGDQYSDAMQALSHFSYRHSYLSMVLCDLQGGICGDEIILSDLAILSRFESYGPADLGTSGIDLFFARHTCNRYCTTRGRPARLPRPAQIPMRQGTTMTRQRPSPKGHFAVV